MKDKDLLTDSQWDAIDWGWLNDEEATNALAVAEGRLRILIDQVSEGDYGPRAKVLLLEALDTIGQAFELIDQAGHSAFLAIVRSAQDLPADDHIAPVVHLIPAN